METYICSDNLDFEWITIGSMVNLFWNLCTHDDLSGANELIEIHLYSCNNQNKWALAQAVNSSIHTFQGFTEI